MSEAAERWRLERIDGRLALLDSSMPRGRALCVDFGSRELRRRRREGRRSLLARAFGLHRGARPAIVDATAGFAADAFILAALGCRVLLLERRELIAALVEDGLRRARAAGGAATEAAQRMELRQCDARKFLRASAAADFDAAYLDPMFAATPKSALNKKSMRILHALAGDDADAAELLAPAQRRAGQRTVVKRRRLAPTLTEAAPDYSLRGAAVRFDVYLRAPAAR